MGGWRRKEVEVSTRPGPESGEPLSEHAEHLRQWSNVYGWTDEECLAAASEDARVQRLLEVELATDIPDAAREIREQMTRYEVCHQAGLENTSRLIDMIRTMTPAPVLGCGEADPTLNAQLRAVVEPLAKWVDGERSEDFGDPTPTRRWLAACMCKMIAEQLGDPTFPQPRWPA